MPGNLPDPEPQLQVGHVTTGVGASLETVTLPEKIPSKGVREPWFHDSDVRTFIAVLVLVLVLYGVLLAVKVYECYLVCKDTRDWNEALDPLMAAGLTAVGSVIGYFFARDRRA